MTEPFFFGVPLIARAVARDWALVEQLLALTLRSVLAQEDREFRLLLAAHDEPACWRALVGGDPRFRLLLADWPPEPVTAANDDGGRKKWLIKQAVLAAGGGLLMFLDADDWIARDLVATARAAIGPDSVGGVVVDGWALDWRTRAIARFPVAGAWDGAFHGLCGSSTVGRLSDGFDPFEGLGWHGDWVANAAAGGHALATLDAQGVYVVGTDRSHSEDQGPYAGWRRTFSAAVRAAGAPLAEDVAARFGLRLSDLAAPALAHGRADEALDEVP